MKYLKFSYDTKVIVNHIRNPERVDHLSKFIGLQGEIISWIRLNEKTTKYKLRFNDNQQHYFYEEELKEIY